VSVTPRGKVDRETVRRFEDLGVHRLIPYRPRVTEKELVEFVARLGDEVIGKG
jgi:hypothetical protein